MREPLECASYKAITVPKDASHTRSQCRHLQTTWPNKREESMRRWQHSCCLPEALRRRAPMLLSIIQQSLDTKTVLDDWKRALVTSIFKEGARSKPENYRPVSLTAICCKVTEHIIVSQTMLHLDLHNILVDCQHGFRRKRSCETQLLITTHNLADIRCCCAWLLTRCRTIVSSGSSSTTTWTTT